MYTVSLHTSTYIHVRNTMHVCVYVRMYVILCVCVCIILCVCVHVCKLCIHTNPTCIFLVSPISFMGASLDSFVTPDGVTFQSCPFLSGQNEADLPLVFSSPEVRGEYQTKFT